MVQVYQIAVQYGAAGIILFAGGEGLEATIKIAYEQYFVSTAVKRVRVVDAYDRIRWDMKKKQGTVYPPLWPTNPGPVQLDLFSAAPEGKKEEKSKTKKNGTHRQPKSAIQALIARTYSEN
jgi:hypothetical protein